MTFRTNQPGSAFASLSAFWEQSMQQNRAMDLRRIPLWSTTLYISVLAFELSPFLFQSKHSTQIAPVAPASASIRRRQPPPPHPQHRGAAPTSALQPRNLLSLAITIAVQSNSWVRRGIRVELSKRSATKELGVITFIKERKNQYRNFN